MSDPDWSRACRSKHPALAGTIDPDTLDERERVACVLESGHDGPHEFIPEDER